MPVSVGLREFKTNWMPCAGRYWHIQHSPDVWSCNFHVFGPTHKAVTSHSFTAAGDLQRAVLWLSQQPEEFFADEIHWLMNHWGSCWNANGDFFLLQFLHLWASSDGFHLYMPHISDDTLLWHYMPMWPRVVHYLGSWFVFVGIWRDSLDEGLAPFETLICSQKQCRCISMSQVRFKPMVSVYEW